jgi:catechol 1,2-dioxygenase
VVRDLDGKPVGGAIVDVWHANTKGFYSFFDKSQTKYNLRRRIETGPDGRYEFQTIIPAGYGCQPDGPTQRLLDQLGRHGQRPAHIHFFVSSPGHRHLTTQINIAGDKYLYDDFAFATREGLIPKIVRHEDAKNGMVTLANGTAAHRDAAALLGYGLGASHTTEMPERFSRRIRGMKEKELNTPFSEIEFDFTLTALAKKDAEDVVNRRRVEAA